MKISNTEVYTDAPTPEGERLMELVHEAAFGNGQSCVWHKWEQTVRHIYECQVCGNIRQTKGTPPSNPAYLTSLDAYRPIWEKMGHEYKLKLGEILHVYGWAKSNLAMWELKPHHHLEALARTLTVPCVCQGQVEITCPTCKKVVLMDKIEGDPKAGVRADIIHEECLDGGFGECTYYDTLGNMIEDWGQDCPTCSGTGTITVLDAWEREIKEEK